MTNQHLLRKLYSDIITGYTEAEHDKKVMFIKHFGAVDQGRIDNSYLTYYERAISRGVGKEADKLKVIIANGLWTEEKEKKIESDRVHLVHLNTNKKNLAVASQAKMVQEEIESVEKARAALLDERFRLIGQTAEDFATTRINELYIINSLYKDKNLISPLIDEEEYDELEPREFSRIVDSYNAKMIEFNHDNLKRVAISQFYQNNFSMTENLYYFFGRPIAFLSHYQQELGYWGKVFQSILNEDKSVPEELKDDPNALLDWYNRTKNIEKQTAPHSNSDVVSMNASKEDVEIMRSKGIETVSIAEIIGKNLGPMELLRELTGKEG